MKFPQAPRQPLVGVALAAIFGILLAEFLSPPIGATCLLIALLAIIGLWRPRPLLTHLLVVGGFFALHLIQQTDAPGRKLAAQLDDRSRAVTAVGTVASEPKLQNNGFTTFLLRLRSIEIGGNWRAADATLSARWKGAPQLGDEIRLTGIAEPIAPARNPGVFDMRAYLARRDVHHGIFARYPENGTILDSRGGNSLLRLAAKSRRWMQATLTRDLEDSPDVAALICGMALGLRHETPNDIEEPFQQTGTLHLFAVAGLHVGIIAQLLWIIALLLRLPRTAAAALIIPCLFFYSAITGLHVSSVRAATMAAVLLGGIFFGRRVLAFNSLAAAAVLILAWDTNQFFTSGFQLSFAVVAAIIVLQRWIFRVLGRVGEPDPFLPRSLVRRSRQFFQRSYFWIARGLSVSGAAWIGSILLISWYFNLITPISLVANLTVVPIAFCILAVGMMSLLAAPFSSALSVVFNNATWSLSGIVLGLVHVFAQLPGGHLYIERPHWPTGAQAEMTVLDAGAGAAVHLRAGGEDWLFDTGSQRDFEGFVRDYLRSRGIDRLDGVLLSHGDSLHIGGANAVLNEFDPKRVIDTGAADRSRVHHALILRLGQRQLLARGDTVSISRKVTARILWPATSYKAKAADDQALVVQLVIGGKQRVLLLSDSGVETERLLLAQPNELRSDVLIKGQHSSGGSGSEKFLDVVQPQLIVATSADFPARERISDAWAQMVRTRGITLFRQDEAGAVKLEFFSDRWRATSFLTHETFPSSSR
jgi:competence protein ComEC